MIRAGALLTVSAIVAGCGGSGGPSGTDRAAGRAVRPPAPSIVEARADADRAGEEVAAPRLASVPSPGTVRLRQGPFTDRVRVLRLRLENGARPEVTGRMLNVADVSELLSLTLRADFYDRAGRHLAAGRQSFGEAEEFHEHALRFRIRASARAPRAAVAVLSIPDLVNE